METRWDVLEDRGFMVFFDSCKRKDVGVGVVW